MNVRKILEVKGQDVITVGPDMPMREFAQIVIQRKIGAAPVTDGDGNLVGVISERDVVRGFDAHGGALTEKSVGDLMTRDVISCAPESSIPDVAVLMSKHAIRHVAVLDDGALVGFISIRDVAFNRLTQLEVDNEALRLMFDNYEAIG
jgi:CBS domain-containing protein